MEKTKEQLLKEIEILIGYLKYKILMGGRKDEL